MDQGRASHISPPRQIGSTASSRVRLYSATSTSQVDALPREWQGHYVRIRAEGGDVDYLVSDYASAAVDHTISATSTGATSTALGDRIPSGDYADVVIPLSAGVTQYLAREASVSTAALRLTLLTER